MGNEPITGVQITLISRDVLTLYSGMLPGYVAGHYSYEDIPINLRELCSWAGVQFIEGDMTGVNLDTKTLRLSEHPDVAYDLLLLDTGSTPISDVPGSHQMPLR